MPEIFVSSSALRAHTVAAAVEECSNQGIRGLELTSSMPPYGGLQDDVRRAGHSGLQLLLHNYFPPPRDPFVLNLASADPAIRERSASHCRAALELSAEIGAPYYSVHAGFVVDPSPDDLGRSFRAPARRSKRDATAMFHDVVASLCETAESTGVSLLIENNVLSRANLIDAENRLLLGVVEDDFDELFDAVHSPRLGMLLDVAHLKVSAMTLGRKPGAMIPGFRRHVKALHLSDNDGLTDSNQGFDAGAWFLPHLGGFPDATRVIETLPLERRGLSECIRLIEGTP